MREELIKDLQKTYKLFLIIGRDAKEPLSNSIGHGRTAPLRPADLNGLVAQLPNFFCCVK